jgi:hypothetical protein
MTPARSETPATQLAGFIAKYDAPLARQIRAARATLRARLPTATEFVYDNYQGLVIGYGPTDRPSEAIVSIVAYFQRVSLCFLDGASLPDPRGILRGSGHVVRSVRLETPAVLDRPEVRALIREAIAASDAPFSRGRKGRTVVRAIAAKQRPRRVRASALPRS